MSDIHQSAFHYLNELASRAQGPGARLPSQQDDDITLWNGIGFRIAGHFCVAPMGDITEVLHEPASTRLPGVKSWVRGVANVRGRLLPLIDMNGFLGEPPCSRGRVLVLEHGELYAGLIVEEVLGLQHFDTADYSDDRGLAHAELGKYVRGSYQHEGQEWSVFRVNRLLSSSQFFQVAA